MAVILCQQGLRHLLGSFLPSRPTFRHISELPPHQGLGPSLGGDTV